MSQKQVLVTWDIDGTLIVGTDAAVTIHQNAFKQVIEELSGKPADIPDKYLQKSLSGFMDQKILKLMFEKAGIEINKETMNKAIARMEDLFVSQCDVVPVLPPGVKEMLDTLAAMPNVTMGIASGNWPKIAWKKLELAKIDHYFKKDNIATLGYFDDRKDALLKAKDEAEKKKNLKFDVCVHIGDTEGDVNAAINAGFIAVAVRTGRCSYQYPQPSHVFVNVEAGRQEILKLIQ